MATRLENHANVLIVPNDVLREMYETGNALTIDGRTVALDSVVTAEFANSLYSIVTRERPELVLEIGLAHGATALSIATALRENGVGRLVSIDPFQRTAWQGVALSALERSGLGHLHTVIEDPDYLALPRLVEEWGPSVQLVYIDGRHSFEYVLLDFFYADRLLELGGVVGFNDCDWLSVIPTLRFVTSHRHYEPLDVGLLPAYGTRNEVVRTYLRGEAKFLPPQVRPSRSRAVARLLGRRREDRYFRKVDEWEPPEGWMPRGWSVRA
jgi:predicted O-methyltransferase YrrM